MGLALLVSYIIFYFMCFDTGVYGVKNALLFIGISFWVISSVHLFKLVLGCLGTKKNNLALTNLLLTIT